MARCDNEQGQGSERTPAQPSSSVVRTPHPKAAAPATLLFVQHAITILARQLKSSDTARTEYVHAILGYICKKSPSSTTVRILFDARPSVLHRGSANAPSAPARLDLPSPHSPAFLTARSLSLISVAYAHPFEYSPCRAAVGPPRSGALTELPPLRILAQIAALQSLYYLAALVLFGFTSFTAGVPFSLDLLLGWEGVRGGHDDGIRQCVCDDPRRGVRNVRWLLCSLLCYIVLPGGKNLNANPCTPRAVAIIILITRYKLVPDFALTLHAIHLLVTTLYTGSIPRNILWWLGMAISSAACVWLASWGCQYRELQPISFGGILGGRGDGGSGSSGGHARGASRSQSLPRRESPPRIRDDDEESEVGFLRGAGRGGRQGSRGAGDYELVEQGRTKR